jgi:hypothetical protein
MKPVRHNPALNRTCAMNPRNASDEIRTINWKTENPKVRSLGGSI